MWDSTNLKKERDVPMQNFEKRRVGQADLEIDTLGLGCARLGGNHVDIDYGQAAELIRAAADAGIAFFDTAPFYGFGRSERVTGDMLRGTEYVLSDKVGRLLVPGPVADPEEFSMIDPLPFHVIFDYGYDAIMRAYEDNLQRLGLDRIDILLAHDIDTITHGDDYARHFRDLAEGGYRAMDELRRSEQVSAIGLGADMDACQDALGIGDWDVFLLAGRYTLLGQTPLDTLFPACQAAGTTIICGAPFNSGILVGRDTWNYAKAPAEIVDKARAINGVAEDHGVSLAATALRFPLGHDIISSVIPGPCDSGELRQILDWFAEPIPGDFWAALKTEGLVDDRAPLPLG